MLKSRIRVSIQLIIFVNGNNLMKFWMKNIFIVFCFVFFVCSLFLVSSVHTKYTASNISDFVSKANQGVGAETVDYKAFTAKIVQAGLGVTGLVFFVLIFYGGYLWLTSGGKEEDIKKAQGTIVASIIGLMIIIGSYALTNLVFDRLVGKSTTGQPKAQVSGGTAGKKDQGCCLDEAQTPGTWLSQWGSQKHWLWEITDADTCEKIGNTKTDEDEIVGEKHWSWTPDIDNYDICGEAAKKL